MASDNDRPDADGDGYVVAARRQTLPDGSDVAAGDAVEADRPAHAAGLTNRAYVSAGGRVAEVETTAGLTDALNGCLQLWRAMGHHTEREVRGGSTRP